MLSAASRPFIAASVPVLREHGLAITRRFYAEMFAAHPELTNLFNMANQANGAQQVSLATALFAYAANIDNAQALAPVASRIAHKHASVGLKPSHYPIVGRYLLSAIKQVLGEAATPGLLAAWDEAYWLLAGQLIAAEATLYVQSGRVGRDFEKMKVVDVRPECEDVTSYCVQTMEGASPGRFAPGQYVSVAVDFPDGTRQIRQYSLSDAPARGYWRITVKREAAHDDAPAGRIGNYLHQHVRPGSDLLVSAPFGDFTPPVDGMRPLALIAAGVGITPMLSVLNALAANTTAPVLLAYAARSPDQHPLRLEVTQARQKLSGLQSAFWYETGAESPDRPGLMQLDAALLRDFREAAFYLCGPLPFMRTQWRALLELGVAPERLHREVFGPEAFDHLL